MVLKVLSWLPLSPASIREGNHESVYKPIELHRLIIEVLYCSGNAPLLVKYLKNVLVLELLWLHTLWGNFMDCHWLVTRPNDHTTTHILSLWLFYPPNSTSINAGMVKTYHLHFITMLLPIQPLLWSWAHYLHSPRRLLCHEGPVRLKGVCST